MFPFDQTHAAQALASGRPERLASGLPDAGLAVPKLGSYGTELSRHRQFISMLRSYRYRTGKADPRPS